MLRAGNRVIYKIKRNSVFPIGHTCGKSEIVHSVGLFQVWHSKTISMWDDDYKVRTCVPATYKIIKRLPPINVPLSGKSVRCNLALVMRVVVAHVVSWRIVRDELVAQVEILGKRKLRKDQEDAYYR